MPSSFSIVVSSNFYFLCFYFSSFFLLIKVLFSLHWSVFYSIIEFFVSPSESLEFGVWFVSLPLWEFKVWWYGLLQRCSLLMVCCKDTIYWIYWWFVVQIYSQDWIFVCHLMVQYKNNFSKLCKNDILSQKRLHNLAKKLRLHYIVIFGPLIS